MQPVQRVLGVALALVTLVAACATLLGHPWGRPFLFALLLVCLLCIAAYCLLIASALHTRLVRTRAQLAQANDAFYDHLMLLADSLGPKVGQQVMEIASARAVAGRTLSVLQARTKHGWVQLRLDAGTMDGLWQGAKFHVSYEDSGGDLNLGTWPARVRSEVTFLMAHLDPCSIGVSQPMLPSKFKVRVIEPQPSHPAIALLADLLSEYERSRVLPYRPSHATDRGTLRELRIGWLRLFVVSPTSFASRDTGPERVSPKAIRHPQSGWRAR